MDILLFPPLASKAQTYLIVVFTSTFLIYMLSRLLARPSLPKGIKLPPGPPGLPIVGNMFQIPPTHSWLKFKEWTDTYGPIVHLKIAGQDHILLGNEHIANALLRERGSYYSSREQLPAAAILLSDNRNSLMVPYGPLFRQTRKFLHHALMAPVAPRYEPQQRLEAIRLLRDIRLTPSSYQTLFERFAVGVAMRVIFGGRLENGDDYEALTILDVAHVLEKVASPGAYLVDLLPWLRHIPSWFPGAGWKRYLMSMQRRDEDFFEHMMGSVRAQIKEGRQVESLAREWLDDINKWGMSYGEGLYVLGGMFEAASGTTPAAMSSFMLAMVRHPSAFAALQKEIDSVVGPDRLPTFADIPSLPLLRATIKEVLRIYPVTAGGVPHKLTRPDIFEGHFLPSGSLIHPNQWAIHRDPALYPDPEAFNPRRWLDPKSSVYKEPLTQHPNINGWSCFGFGRRQCPGINMAERSLNLQVAFLAWGCDIRRAKDADGKEIVPPFYDFTHGFNVAPKKFELALTGRGRERDELIEGEYARSLREDPLL